MALRHPSQSVSLTSATRCIRKQTPILSGFQPLATRYASVMTHDPEARPDRAPPRHRCSRVMVKRLFHLRGSSLPQVWALDIATGADRQLSFHDEKLRCCAVRRWTTG